MQLKVKISALNHIRFVPEDVEILEQYHNIPFDKAWFSEQLRPWEQPSTYAYPMQKNDQLDIQIWSSVNIAAVLKVYKCGNSTPVDILIFQLPSGMPTIIEDNIQYYVQRIRIKKFFDTYNEGTYYFEIEFPLTVIKRFISEPIYVKADHKGTIIIDVGNTFNKDYVIFEQTRQRFRHRVPGALLKIIPKVSRTVFTEQDESTVPLSATAYRNRKLVLGGNGAPIPDWQIDKMNHVFTCDGTFIEGEQFTAVEGATFQPEEDDVNTPLSCVSIELADGENNKPYDFVTGSFVLLEPIPPYPFVLKGLQYGYLNNPIYSMPSFTAPTEINDPAELQTWIDGVNADILAQGFEGTVTIEPDNSIVYNNGPAENYTTGSIDILTFRLGVKCFINGAPIPIDIQLSASTLEPSYYAVALPDGTMYSWGLINTLVTINANYTAPIGGTVNYVIWHDGRLTTILLSGSSINGIDQYGSSTALPSKLAIFGISQSTQLTSFLFYEEMRYTMNTLQAFIMTNNTVLSDIGVFYPQFAWAIDGWKLLRQIDLRGNNLNSAMKDAWYNSMQTPMTVPGNGPLFSQFYVFGGTIRTNLQNPAANVTAASAGARSVLLNTWNWLIIT